MARDLVRDFDVRMPVVIDRPDENLFERFYAPWPVRIFILDEQRRLIYKAEPSETMLQLRDLEAHLRSMVKLNE